jgi:flagellar basal body-associated protein FliL
VASQEATQNSDIGKNSGKSFTLLQILNSIVLLATLSLLYYSKLIYKRPPITESKERERIAALQATPALPPTPMLIPFDPITANIRTYPEQANHGEQISQKNLVKSHYATVAFSLEIRDSSQKEFAEMLRPYILDKLIQLLGKKQFHELTTDQGRYILTAELISSANQLAQTHTKNPSKEPLVNHLYYTQFIVQ